MEKVMVYMQQGEEPETGGVQGLLQGQEQEPGEGVQVRAWQWHEKSRAVTKCVQR